MKQFSVEEMNLMCIYNIDSRQSLLADLREGLADVYEHEMREVFESAIAKLENLSDEEFSEIGFYIADEYLDGEESDIAE